MALAPFPIDEFLTDVAIRYRNKTFIADQVLPRIQVGTQVFKYLRYTMEEQFTLPDTLVGRKSRVTEIELTAEEVTAKTLDYGLEDPIPNVDLENARDPNVVIGHAVETLTDLILLDRELRVANLVFNPDTYPVGRKTTLSGTSQWSHPDSNPVDAMLAAMDEMVMRPNIIVMGATVWTKLRQHPRVVQAVFRTAQNAGVVMREQLAELLEVDEIIIGEGKRNLAKRGQAANISYIWGPHCAMLMRDSLADTRNSRTTFGFTAVFTGLEAGRIDDPMIGLRGGVRVRVGESVAEVVCAPDLGYFFQNAIA